MHHQLPGWRMRVVHNRSPFISPLGVIDTNTAHFLSCVNVYCRLIFSLIFRCYRDKSGAEAERGSNLVPHLNCSNVKFNLLHRKRVQTMTRPPPPLSSIHLTNACSIVVISILTCARLILLVVDLHSQKLYSASHIRYSFSWLIIEGPFISPRTRIKIRTLNVMSFSPPRWPSSSTRYP